jgi:hypothetical protein
VGAQLEKEVVEARASMFEHGVLLEVKAAPEMTAPDTLWVNVDRTLVDDRDRQNMWRRANKFEHAQSLSELVTFHDKWWTRGDSNP